MPDKIEEIIKDLQNRMEFHKEYKEKYQRMATSEQNMQKAIEYLVEARTYERLEKECYSILCRI